MKDAYRLYDAWLQDAPEPDYSSEPFRRFLPTRSKISPAGRLQVRPMMGTVFIPRAAK